MATPVGTATGTNPIAVDEDRALKAKLRGVWAMGDYVTVARQVIPSLGPILVTAAGVGPGDTVVDVAAGAGNAAIPAAVAGARVVATDLTPQLLEAGRARAERDGVALEWREADAEALPFADASFDVVLSCVGVMFAPHHQRAADELIRVCRPGGRVALISWTPQGFIGQMFAAMKPYAAAPPPAGVQPPPLWGDESHVQALLGDRVMDVTMQRSNVAVDLFDSPEAFRDYFKANYGPTVAAYRAIAEDGDRVAALDRDLADLARRNDLGDGKGATRMEWEYLLLTARVAG